MKEVYRKEEPFTTMTPAELAVVTNSATRIALKNARGVVVVMEEIEPGKVEGHIFGHGMHKQVLLETLAKSLNITKWQMIKAAFGL